VRCSLKVTGWLHRTFLLLHNWLRRTPRRLAGRLPSANSPPVGESVAFGELPADWCVGWLRRTRKRFGWLRRAPRWLAGRLPSPNSPQGGVSVGFAELPAGWRVGSCSIGVRLRLKPKSNITLQAEPAFDRLTAGQRLNPTIRSIENAISLLIRMKPAFFYTLCYGLFLFI